MLVLSRSSRVDYLIENRFQPLEINRAGQQPALRSQSIVSYSLSYDQGRCITGPPDDVGMDNLVTALLLGKLRVDGRVHQIPDFGWIAQAYLNQPGLVVRRGVHILRRIDGFLVCLGNFTA